MNGDRVPLAHCPVHGHGTRCIVAEEIQREREKRTLRRWRRRQAQRALDRELRADVPGMTYAELRAFRERVEAAMREEDRIFGRTA